MDGTGESMKPELCIGQIMHRRLRPMSHQFTYPTYFLRFSVDHIAALENRWLSLNRFNLFSFYNRDHGARDGSELSAWVRQLLAQHNINQADGDIVLHTYPRVLGYVFNPVSFWFCHGRDGRVHAIVCEVNNTFGEHHIYLLAHPDQRSIIEGETLQCRKVFHVSPFLEVSGDYQFAFNWEGERCLFRIDHLQADKVLLNTALSGIKRPLTSRLLLRLFFRNAWMTLAVIARIHLQALRLWLKGAQFHSKPTPPIEETSR
jgi:DUF1365 family protein